MTPKKRAENIIESYKKIPNAMIFMLKESVINHVAKECALLSVKVTLNALIYPPAGNKQIVTKKTLDYWKEVQLEIEKLRGTEPPYCWGEDDCSTMMLSQCAWRNDCNSPKAVNWQLLKVQ